MRLWLMALLLWSSLAEAGTSVHVLRVSGVINTGTERYISRGLDAAKSGDAELVVIVLDTPGGLLESTRQIVQKMNASRVPVGVYVSPSGAAATSAGTIITMAGHFAGMAPGTNIGAAHPVGGQGEDIKGEMNKKAVNDTVAFIKAQAALHGRNTEWAEQAIRKSVAATADEAVKLKVVDFLAEDLNAAIMAIDGRSVHGQPVKAVGLPIREIAMTAAEQFLSFIGHPNVSYILMMIGGLGIYAELSTPGAVLPGVLGAIALILSLISFSTLPVNSGAVALLVLGFILLALEPFVTSYGVLSIGGVASLILGAMFLLDPSTGDLRLSLALVIPTVAAIGVIMGALGYLLLRSRKAVYEGLDHYAGEEAAVDTLAEDGRSGKCRLRGEIWDFTLSESAPAVHVGDRVLVEERKGLKLRVRGK